MFKREISILNNIITIIHEQNINNQFLNVKIKKNTKDFLYIILIMD